MKVDEAVARLGSSPDGVAKYGCIFEHRRIEKKTIKLLYPLKVRPRGSHLAQRCTTEVHCACVYNTTYA